MKSNKSISRKNFLTKIHFFSNFKNGQKSIFELGKSLKLPEMQFHEKNFTEFSWKILKNKFREIDIFDFTSFFLPGLI